MGHREELLKGAKRALYEKGYARTTARDIVALSGTNLGSIGYHYGSTEALMTAAMMSAMQEWGDQVAIALAGSPQPRPDGATEDRAAEDRAPEDRAAEDGAAEDRTPEDGADPLVAFWRRVIASITEHRSLWLASVEVMIQAEHHPELRAMLAAGVREGRSGMAALLTGRPEDQVDESTVRTLGSVQMALMSGVVTQWLTDPAGAPTAEEIVAGIRALSSLTTAAPPPGTEPAVAPPR